MARSPSFSHPTTGRRVSDSRRGWLPYVAFAAIALIWGASFLFIKVAVQDMSPTVLVLIRSSTGLLALAVIMAAPHRRLIPADWKERLLPFAIMAITGGVLPWVGIAWGEERIWSGLASTLNATTPLFAAILVFWVIPSERPSLLNYAGVLIGLAGVVILVLRDLTAGGLRGGGIRTFGGLLGAAAYAGAGLFPPRRGGGVNGLEGDN